MRRWRRVYMPVHGYTIVHDLDASQMMRRALTAKLPVPIRVDYHVARLHHGIILMTWRQRVGGRIAVFPVYEKLSAAVPTVQNVVNHASFGGSSGSWHQGILSGLTESVNISEAFPALFSRP
jgi:hypothetical protein